MRIEPNWTLDAKSFGEKYADDDDGPKSARDRV
jgi:hypothetical protein